MKKFFGWFFSALPHINITLSIMMLTFFFIDRVNEYMAFINNDITKALLAVMSFCVIVSSILLIYYQRRAKRNSKKPKEQKSEPAPQKEWYEL